MLETDRVVDVAKAFERLPTSEAIAISAGGKRYASSSTTDIVALANAAGRLSFFDSANHWCLARFNSTAVAIENGSSDWVASGSPAPTDCGLVVTAGVLQMVMGSAAARKVGWHGMLVKFDSIVYSDDPSWAVLITDADGIVGAYSGTGAFSTGPTASPRGSVKLVLPVGYGDQSVQLRSSQFKGIKVSDITDLSYWTYAEAWNGNQLPYLTLWINLAGDPEGAPDDRIIFEPYFSTVESGLGSHPNVVANAWQQWDVHAGNCYFDATGGYLTLAAYGAANPDAVIVEQDATRGGLRLASGFCSSSDAFVTYIDGIQFNAQAFDFEPG